MGFGIFVLILMGPLLVLWLLLRRRGGGGSYGGPNDGPARAPFAADSRGQPASYTHPVESDIGGSPFDYSQDDGRPRD